MLVSAESVRSLRELSRLAEAIAAGEEALDRARLIGNRTSSGLRARCQPPTWPPAT